MSENKNISEELPELLSPTPSRFPHEVFESAPVSSPKSSIEDRIQRAYVDRLETRFQKMRKLYIRRDWTSLRQECSHLRSSASSFGFNKIKELAEKAENSLEAKSSSRAQVLPGVKTSIHDLFLELDSTIIGRLH